MSSINYDTPENANLTKTNIQDLCERQIFLHAIFVYFVHDLWLPLQICIEVKALLIYLPLKS